MPRKINVVTVAMANYRAGSVQGNVDYALGLLDTACRLGPDIVCLPENFATVGIGDPKAEIAQPVPGPITEACSKRAREYSTFVICPLTRLHGDKAFNSAVIIDRRGEVAGVYDKAHPVTHTDDYTGAEHGLTPGPEDVPVFDLDFGRVGCQICFDLGFPETWALLKQKGAEIVFWPSAYDGGRPLWTYAYLHEYFVVSAVRTATSRIVNPQGDVLAATSRRSQVAARVIDLDHIICHADWHVDMPRRLIDRYGTDVSVTVYAEEGHFIVESNSDGLPLSAIVAEFGLEPCRTYHRRHHPMYRALREGAAPEPQETPYKGRQQYG
ncbi:MAG: carbon-nitrogen hydrolase family protein [Planctomycetes bacterium]|nr:carbon-nitrogen hydrolase family protein [Planctomycetota bacterium]